MNIRGIDINQAIQQTKEALHATYSTEQALNNLHADSQMTLEDHPFLMKKVNSSGLPESDKRILREKLARARAALEQAMFAAEQGQEASGIAHSNGQTGMIRLQEAVEAANLGDEMRAANSKEQAMTLLGAAESARKTAIFKMSRAGASLMGGIELMRQVEQTIFAATQYLKAS